MTTLAVFLTALFLGMPIVFILAVGTIIFLVEMDVAILLDTTPLQLFKSVEKNGLLAIPMFMLVGELMNRGGITERLIDFTDLFVGRFKGGLAYVNLLTNTMASAILGSATAQIAVMTRTMVPAMVSRGYDRAFSTAVSVAGGMLGPVIPPSMLMIIYGIVSYQSVAALFVAGILPGLLIAGGFAVVIIILGFVYTYPDDADRPALPFLSTFMAGLLPLSIPGVIIGGVVSGVMTPTESGALASAMALIVGMFLYRKIAISDIAPILAQVALNSATVVSLIGMATLFGWALAFESVPDMLAEAIKGISESGYVFLLLVNIVIIVLGMFLDGIGVMIVIVPILLPVAQNFGIDPIHFGVVIAISTLVGLLTPPVGPGLYVAMEATGVRMAPLFRAVLPFLVSMLLSLTIINLVPVLSTWLPRLLELY